MPWAQAFPLDNWPQTHKDQKETVTNLQFYLHDTVSGKNPSAIKVAQSADTEKSPTLFGAIMMADDPLTQGPDPNTKLAMSPVREMPIVGGTGLFRLALGYAIAKTHWFDITTGDAIVGYNVTVVH
ncbi:hypothetical protein GH714_030335 [Hevea brasiliensis]|uniref:Dirigent protein n=1 Tax=Hevea brasiliensis TaxID=3981 RepID=A0A6A6N977_HEVBR|nr:hypothetical protein GH714_030335 [Hevea brasiliensis]